MSSVRYNSSACGYACPLVAIIARQSVSLLAGRSITSVERYVRRSVAIFVCLAVCVDRSIRRSTHRPFVGLFVFIAVGLFGTRRPFGRFILQSVNRSIGRSVGRSVGRLVGRSVFFFVGLAVRRRLREATQMPPIEPAASGFLSERALRCGRCSGRGRGRRRGCPIVSARTLALPSTAVELELSVRCLEWFLAPRWPLSLSLLSLLLLSLLSLSLSLPSPPLSASFSLTPLELAPRCRRHTASILGGLDFAAAKTVKKTRQRSSRPCARGSDAVHRRVAHPTGAGWSLFHSCSVFYPIPSYRLTRTDERSPSPSPPPLSVPSLVASHLHRLSPLRLPFR